MWLFPCARAAIGYAAAEPATTLMKSRRLIACAKAKTTPTSASMQLIKSENFDQRNGVQRPICVAENLGGACPLWVTSGHMRRKSPCRFTPNSDRESGLPAKVMSALPPKADMCGATRDV